MVEFHSKLWGVISQVADYDALGRPLEIVSRTCERIYSCEELIEQVVLATMVASSRGDFASSLEENIDPDSAFSPLATILGDSQCQEWWHLLDWLP